MNHSTLSLWASEELKALIAVLPDDVQAAAKSLAISLEERPGPDDTDLDGTELGLFDGPSAMDDVDGLPRIRLFLANLWDWVERDEQDFRDEVGTTFLHELGHYLGWDENDLSERGLD